MSPRKLGCLAAFLQAYLPACLPACLLDHSQSLLRIEGDIDSALIIRESFLSRKPFGYDCRVLLRKIAGALRPRGMDRIDEAGLRVFDFQVIHVVEKKIKRRLRPK